MKQPPTKPPPLVETRINQEAIGARLRQMFDEVASEPIPEDFLEILRQHDDETPPPKRTDADTDR
jgi:hypothetical protein